VGVALLVGACATPRGISHHTPERSNSHGPWSISDGAPIVASAAHHGASTSAGTRPHDGAIDFLFDSYARTLTKVDGPRCDHRPTCSRYALLAIKEHGYTVGTMMTIDRLIRGKRSSRLRSLPTYDLRDGQHLVYDPVEANDFWF
jgi:hypothetical protein